MEIRRMLQQGIIKGTTYFIFMASISCAFEAASPSIAAAYTTSSMTIGAQSDLILATKSALDTKISVVFDHMSLERVAQVLSERIGIPIKVEANYSQKLVESLGEKITLHELIQRISASSGTFLVYRDGFLLFTAKTEMNVRLRRELSASELSALARRVSGMNPVISVDGKKMRVLVNREEFLAVRETLIDAKTSAEVVSSDQVVEQLEVI